MLAAVPHLPVWLNRGLLVANRWPARLYGPAYARHAALLATTERAYDNTPALLAAVNAAIAHVPYYRDRYRPVRSVADFEDTVGFLTKDDVVAHAGALTSRAVDVRAYEACSTGGTEGRPLSFLVPRDRYVVELATMHALWGRAGWRHDVRAVIRNHRLPAGQPYAINPITREVIFDGFRLDPDALARVYTTLGALGIRFVHCYPSTAYELARVIRDRDLDASAITAFLCGSENVFAHQRALIQDTLGIRFHAWYGHSEKLVLAGYCRDTDVFHVEPTYGYFELVDDAGRVIREPGHAGEIVGTSLHNPGMPLIRYRTGDRGEYAGDHCSACGRRVPLLRAIHGRWSGERVYRADGTFVTTTSLNLHADLNRALDGLQYVQHRAGELVVLVVPGPGFTAAHEHALRAHLVSTLGAATSVTIERVAQLHRRPNGKFTQLLSSVRS